MNRVEIKNKAEEMIKGNKWYIWKPMIIIGLVIALVDGIAFGLDAAFGLTKETTMELLGTKTTYTQPGIISTIVGIFTGIAGSALSVGYSYYILSFVRGKKMELKDVIDFMKKHWVIAFISGLLVGLSIVLGMILLIVPGIILTIGLMYYQEVCADNPSLKATEIVRKSWEMTKGHKMDLFVMGLSFIGWAMLTGVTFGILTIWLTPYIVVSFTLAYEEIKK